MHHIQACNDAICCRSQSSYKDLTQNPYQNLKMNHAFSPGGTKVRFIIIVDASMTSDDGRRFLLLCGHGNLMLMVSCLSVAGLCKCRVLARCAEISAAWNGWLNRLLLISCKNVCCHCSSECSLWMNIHDTVVLRAFNTGWCILHLTPGYYHYFTRHHDVKGNVDQVYLD